MKSAVIKSISPPIAPTTRIITSLIVIYSMLSHVGCLYLFALLLLPPSYSYQLTLHIHVSSDLVFSLSNVGNSDRPTLSLLMSELIFAL